MRRRPLVVGRWVARALVAGAASAAGATTWGCTDLFHSTADIRSACEIDASIPGCSADAAAATDVQVDFCSWSTEEARTQAARVCGLLGACQGPLGGNAFGPCSVEARLAFDCAANPNHRVAGALRDRWACLATATTCAEVDACVGVDPSVCGDAGASVVCAGDGGALRVACPGGDGGAPAVEDCALWGQSCDLTGGVAACGPSGAPIDCSVNQSTCGTSRATVQVCPGDGGSNVGVDCAGNGGQSCAAFPVGSAASWVACIPSPTTDAGCDAGLAITCSGGVAQSCPTGVPETVDCASLLDSPDACAGGALAWGFDWTSGCTLGTACAPDSCDGDVLTSCSRGAIFRAACAADLHLGPCHLVATNGGTLPRAACAPP